MAGAELLACVWGLLFKIDLGAAGEDASDGDSDPADPSEVAP